MCVVCGRQSEKEDGEYLAGADRGREADGRPTTTSHMLCLNAMRTTRARGAPSARRIANSRPGPQHCPKCDATKVKATILTLAYVYLRCQHCGEVWVIPARRETPRAGTRLTR
jgi:hypothetical protein